MSDDARDFWMNRKRWMRMSGSEVPCDQAILSISMWWSMNPSLITLSMKGILKR